MSGDTVRAKQRARPQIPDDVDSNLDETSRVQDCIQSMLSDDSDEEYGSDNHSDNCSLGSCGTSTNLSLITDGLRRNKGINKSFSTYQLREIERTNSVLMDRIIKHGTRKTQFPLEAPKQNRSTSNLINRNKKQKEIDRNNLILLKRIQSIKPFGLSKPKK